MSVLAIKAHADGEWGHVEGLAIPFGGPFAGKDIDGEFFTDKTDFALDWFPEDGRPLLYHHGLDKSAGIVAVGRQTKSRKDVDGIWVEAQLDKASKYADSVWKLIEQESLFFSSGALPYLVQKKGTGEITTWPWVEQSMTPTPANPYAVASAAKAIKSFEDVGLSIPEQLQKLGEDEQAKAIKAEEDQNAALAGKSVKKKRKSPAMAIKADGQGGSPFSQEDINQRIRDLMREWWQTQHMAEPGHNPTSCYCSYPGFYIDGSYPASNYVIICSYDDDGTQWKVPYQVVGETVTIGIPIPGVMVFEAISGIKAGRAVSMANKAVLMDVRDQAVAGQDAAQLILNLIDELVDAATGEDEEGEMKAGRAISAATKKTLTDLHGHAHSMETAATSIKSCLKSLMGDEPSYKSSDEDLTTLDDDILAAEISAAALDYQRLTLDLARVA